MPITTCDSPQALRAEIETIRKKVSLDETEDTWDTITQGILHLAHLCNNGGCDFPSEMVAAIRSVSRPLNSALNSERSRLSGATVDFLTALATGLGSSFDPLVSQFVPTLLALCGRTNKVFNSRAKACTLAIIQHTRLPSLLPYLAELANHKSVLPRLTAAEGILACLNCFNPPDLEKESRARVVEDFIKLTARDASADVRKASKEVFKAYKALMPARVDNFVAPLTPVVKKYLDIQTVPAGIHGIPSNAGQKQISRPSSRANNKVMEAGQRPASSALSKPPTRPANDDPAHSTRQRLAGQGPPTTVGIHAPRQRTVSQMQRDPPQPRSLHINVQSSSAAQRCIVPTPAPSRQAAQHLPPGTARVLPAPNATSTGGPQRPPSAQMRFNPPPDRLKVTGNGAKRIPLPSVPVSGHAGEQVAAAADPGGRAGSTIDKPRPKFPGRNADGMPLGKLAVGRKAPESARSASSSTKPSNRTAPTGPMAVQRSHRPLIKSGTSNPSRIAPQRRPPRNAQKSTRSLVNSEKETSPTLIPLPPSPSTSPTEIPLPQSPDGTPRPPEPEAQDEPVLATLSGSTEPARKQLRSAEPCQEQGDTGTPSTPITTLLASIQRGFLFTPSSPLSPPQNYLPIRANLPEKRPNTIIVSDLTKAPLAGAPFCTTLEGDSAADGLDRHALRDLSQLVA
ncbi:clasp N terminal-domain-containing protein [Boletus reticuloceps]|uniref:Clasp N terminal-domain-containing protein n=2 Tax=Boletus reticuloceps TaxID=495285 RepID=A0A8I3A6Q3_9AGAM|nr:clasp N terminal-domain-containing protein [Boletus reticuloceps]